jgi:hypothetical protein
MTRRGPARLRLFHACTHVLHTTDAEFAWHRRADALLFNNHPANDTATIFIVLT